jgi:S1-C subfamily serine protease
LVLVNVVQAEVLLSRCFHGGYANFYMQKLNEEHKFEINSTRTVLRETTIISDLRPDAIAQFGKIEVHSYKINYFDENIISAVGFAADGYIKQILTIEPKKQKYRIVREDSESSRRITDDTFKCEKVNLAAMSKSGSGSVSGSSKSGASGSAFFINNKGNIITNNHVVERCGGPVKVLYNKKEYSAKVLSKDGNLDLAVLSSDIKPNQYLKLSKKSGDKLDRVVAAGYPLGYKISDELKLTAGIVSATKGWKDNINEFQIDAALNPGNSGGPVVNDAGNLFGVAVAGLADRQNLNFAIKSKAVKDFLDVNKVNYSTATVEFDMDNKKRLKLLEDSTVFIYCN